MPRTWTSVEQKAWMDTKVAGFIDARTRGRSTAYAKGVHRSFSELWPEMDELFAQRTGQRPFDLNATELEELVAFKKKRGVQIYQWLQRNSTQRGRLANRAVKRLLRDHGPRRRRGYQPGEVYNKLYPMKVNAVYQERKVEGLSRGQRLNLIKKISDELFEAETEEVKEEVLAEQAKRRDELDAMINNINSTDNADLDELTLQQYIDQLPELLTSVMGEISRFCPDWGFLVLASGPMPKANGATHVFDIYTGPKTVEGYGFAEAHEDFDLGLRIPFGNFVEGGIVENAKREQAKAALDGLKHTIPVDSDHESAGPSLSSPIASRETSPFFDADSDNPITDLEDNDDRNDIESPPTRKSRHKRRAVVNSDDEEDEDALEKPPPALFSDSEDEGEALVHDDSSMPKPSFKLHPLEVWPIKAPGSEGEDEPESETEVHQQQPKHTTSSQKRPPTNRGSESDQEERVRQVHAKLAAKREESTKKRLETRKKNKEKKEAELAAARVVMEAEAAKKAKEVEVAKKARKAELAKKAREFNTAAAKKAKEVKTANKTKEVEASEQAGVGEVTENAQEKRSVVVYKSRNASKSAVETVIEKPFDSSITTADATKTPGDEEKSKKTSKGAASTTKGKGSNRRGSVAKAGSKSTTKDNDEPTSPAAPATKRRPPPAIIPSPPVAPSKPTTPDVPLAESAAPSPKPKGKKAAGRKRAPEQDNVAADPSEEAVAAPSVPSGEDVAPSPKPKGKKPTGRKRTLEQDDVAADPPEEVLATKRPRRQVNPPKAPDADVSFAGYAKRSRRK